MTDWTEERNDVLRRFSEELAKATGDGSKKRQAGTKPPWYRDESHEGAIFSHLTKWKRGELVDPDSGAHPLVHLAWRALAIVCQESGNVPAEPGKVSLRDYLIVIPEQVEESRRQLREEWKVAYEDETADEICWCGCNGDDWSHSDDM